MQCGLALGAPQGRDGSGGAGEMVGNAVAYSPAAECVVLPILFLLCLHSCPEDFNIKGLSCTRCI